MSTANSLNIENIITVYFPADYYTKYYYPELNNRYK